MTKYLYTTVTYKRSVFSIPKWDFFKISYIRYFSRNLMLEFWICSITERGTDCNKVRVSERARARFTATVSISGSHTSDRCSCWLLYRLGAFSLALSKRASEQTVVEEWDDISRNSNACYILFSRYLYRVTLTIHSCKTNDKQKSRDREREIDWLIVLKC